MNKLHQAKAAWNGQSLDAAAKKVLAGELEDALAIRDAVDMRRLEHRANP